MSTDYDQIDKRVCEAGKAEVIRNGDAFRVLTAPVGGVLEERGKFNNMADARRLYSKFGTSWWPFDDYGKIESDPGVLR